MTRAAQRRSRDRRDTGARAQLLAAARECLRTLGTSRTSSRAISDAAGANLAAITYYFGSKDELVATALAEELREWTEPALALLDRPLDPATRLLAAVRTLDETFEAQRDRAPALLEVFVHAARDPDPANPLARLWERLRTRLAAVVADLRSAGAVPAWVAPDAMAALVVAVVTGTVVSATVGHEPVDQRAIADQFVRLLLAARERA